MSADDLSFRIAKLQLAPGDIVVIKTQKWITNEAADRIRQIFKDLFPDGSPKTLIIEPGMDISILTQAQIAERAA